MSVRVLTGDAREVLRTLPDASVHMCVTSPPYYGLRDYGVPGQMGLEATPEEWVQGMVGVFREVRRVLRPDGTLWLNIGDSYAGSGKGPSNSLNKDNPHSHQARNAMQFANGQAPTQWLPVPSGCKPKDLIGIPWMLAFALRADGWYLRADIIWAKPNPMPESVTDRPTKAHEYLFLLSKSRTYYYDADAIREPHSDPRVIGGEFKGTGGVNAIDWAARQKDGLSRESFAMNSREYNPAGRNKRSVWTVATEAFPESHFATYPTALIEPCIKAGTSEKGCCPECGAPWVREVGREIHTNGMGRAHIAGGDSTIGQGWEGTPRASISVSTVGWLPTCTHRWEASSNHEGGGCPPVPCTVLDPFAGAFTTALVAERLGRDSIMVEINPAYVEMGRKRVIGDAPLFTEVEVA